MWQLDDVGAYAEPLEALGELVGTLLPGLVVVLIESDVNRTAWLISKLIQLSRRQLCANSTGGVAKTGLPQHGHVEQPFDQDENQAGQRSACQLARRLQNAGIPTRVVQLPPGHDPNSYFVAGATAADFTDCLERAQQL